MGSEDYLSGRAAACRSLARQEREPKLAQALLDLARDYERQMQCSAPKRGSEQMG